MADLVFSTPTWINTIINQKMAAKIQDRTNAVNTAINDAKIASQERIAELDRQSNEAIAEAKRASDESIASERRTVDKEIAQINAMSKMGSSVIRTFPPLFISMNGGKSNPGSNTTNKPTGGVSGPPMLPAPQSSTQSAREKADGLFPSLEPTFKFNYSFHNVEEKSPAMSRATGSARVLPSLDVKRGTESNLGYFLAIPAIGLAMGAGSKAAMKQFSDDYMFGDIK